MDQTPAHDSHNPDLLRLIPEHSMSLIEIGCSSGILAKGFKKTIPECHYYGINIVPEYFELTKRFCDRTATMNIDEAGEQFFKNNNDRDCWIFCGTLEHLKDPWRVLKLIRANMPADGSVVACIPIAQHCWLVARLSIGDFRYEDSGLLDRTHLRWFTRKTIIEMFDGAGLIIADGFPRIFNEPQQDPFLPIICELAKAAGLEPEATIKDSLALQYVIRAVPN